MFRFVYSWIIRLHPGGFRKRYAEEMLSIFDEVNEKSEAAKLMADGFISLMRQWTLRSQYWEESDTRPVHTSADGVPIFHTFESFTPRPGALIDGGILTLVVFCSVSFALKYRWTHPVFLPFSGIQSNTGFADGSDASLSTTPPDYSTPVRSERASNLSHPGAKSLVRVHSLLRRSPPSPSSSAELSEMRAEPRSNNLDLQQSPIAVQSLGQTAASPASPTETSSSYAGTYATDPPNELTVLITPEHRQLSIKISGEPKAILVPTHGVKFLFSEARDDWVEFVRYDDGTVSGVIICRNGSHFTAHRKAN